MVFFNFFTPPPEITIELNGHRPVHKLRPLKQSVQEVECAEDCIVINDKESLEGTVLIRINKASTIEHCGISIELCGVINCRSGEVGFECFMLNKIQLAHPSESPINREVTHFEFSFGNIRLPYESYDSSGISLRYFLRAVVHRKMTDYSKEMTIWRPREVMDLPPTPSIDDHRAIEIEVGLPEFLHIQLKIDRLRYSLQDQVTGRVDFLLVRARIVDAEISLVRKEILSSGEIIQSTTLYTKQILEGAAQKGDSIPVHLDLGVINAELTGSIENLAGRFSVRYYVAIFLRDFENRKYYKQLEITLQDEQSDARDSRHVFSTLASYRVGLCKT